MSQTSNVWKIFAHTTALTGTMKHAHTQIISDARDTFGITESFGCELIIFRSFSGSAVTRRSGNLPLDVYRCGWRANVCVAVDATTALHDDSAARVGTHENGYGILNQCHVGGISFTVLQRHVC